MRLFKLIRKVISVGIFLVAATLTLSGTVTAEVYINMLWDEQSEGFKVKELEVPDGVTFDRGYQNAYGVINKLPEGPPFYIQAGISGAGSITFESGGFDPLNPFVIYVTPSGGSSTHISGGDGVNFIGSTLDPIKIEGPFKIHSGVDYQYHDLQWINTEFRCVFNEDVWNHNPFTITGGSALIENCYFPDYSEPFNQLLSILDFGSEKRCKVTIRNCRFERINFPNQTYPIIVRDAGEFTLEDCHFEDVDYWYDDQSYLIDIRGCGIKSIKGNTGNNGDQNKLLLVDAEVVDSAMIRCSDDLPIIANEIRVPSGGALTIGQGSVLKFYANGGLDVGGRLYVDSAVLTSWEDDSHGGNTDHKVQPDPITSNWMSRGSGILIDSGASADIRRTLIRYPRSGIHSFGGLTLDSVTIEDSWYSGVVLRGAGAHNYEISNTTIQRITRVDPYSAAIFYENRTGYPQSLTLTDVNLYDNEVDGVEVFYIGDTPTSIEMSACRIANNEGYGIVFPIDPGLESVEILHSAFVGNSYAAIRGLDNYGIGVPIRIDNNLLIGNGLNQYGTYPYGIHLSGGEAKIVGNTVIDNGEVGILVGGLDNIEQCVIANNLMVGHTEYGLFKSDDGAPVVAGNNFWNNGNETEELRYEGPDGRIYTVEDLQALGDYFVTNINVDPGLVPELSGEIDTLFFATRLGRSKLVDESAGFTPQAIAGRVICPDTAEPRWYPIFSLAGDTLIITGDITDNADTGSVYRILDYHLSQYSQVIDAGFTSQTQETLDIDSEARILDGDENGSMLVDIGADEFNGEAAASPIRVLEPSSEKWLVAYQTFAVEWQVPDSVASVDIDYNTSYDETQPEVGWQTIAAGTDATSGYYSWHVPDNETSMKCHIRVRSTAHPDLFGLSAPFKIKQLGFTRVRNDSLILYNHPDDSWQFLNDSATMWPAEAWPSYMLDNDPYTGSSYPLEFADLRAQDWDFPSWPTFVAAFGFNTCYFDYWPTPQYRPSAVLRWGAIKEKWEGSCYGLAVTDLMAFEDSAAFAERPEIGSFSNLHSLTMTEERRNLINRYHVYQYGKLFIDHANATKDVKPSETLAELRSMFSRLEISPEARVMILCDSTSVNGEGCHAVTPYLLERVSQEDNLWAVLVYDNNYPNDFCVVDIDADSESWSYVWNGWTGNRELTLEDPLSNYTGPAEMTAAPRQEPAVALAEGFTEVYLSDADSVRIGLGVGAVGKYQDSLFNDIPGAWPIIPNTAGSGDPIGYALPDGNLSCRVSGANQDYAHLTVFADNLVMAYRRDGVGPSDVEQVDVRGGDGLHLVNPDEADRTCDIDFVVVAPDRERLLALDNLLQPALDSTALELTPATGLRVANYGAESSYDLVVRDLGESGVREFSHTGIALGGNSEQQLVPNWDNVGEAQLMVIIDDGIDGIVDDTIYLSNGSPLDVDDDNGTTIPISFELSQNYPNPFNPVTTIEYAVPSRSRVTIEVFNVLGQKVRTLVSDIRAAGYHTVVWDGDNSAGTPVASGVYLYRFQAGDHVETRKMLLLK